MYVQRASSRLFELLLVVGKGKNCLRDRGQWLDAEVATFGQMFIVELRTWKVLSHLHKTTKGSWTLRSLLFPSFPFFPLSPIVCIGKQGSSYSVVCCSGCLVSTINILSLFLSSTPVSHPPPLWHSDPRESEWPAFIHTYTQPALFFFISYTPTPPFD